MRRLLAVALILSLVSVAPAKTGATINVPADQPTIQAAITAAADGDTIEVAPGKYAENLVVASRNFLTIHTAGPTFLTPKSSDPVLSIDSSSFVTFQGFTISKSKTDGMALRSSGHVSILNCKISKSKGNGIWATACDDLTIADCTVTKTGKDLEGISVSFGNQTPSARCHVARCTVSKTGGEGIDVHGDSPVIEDCIVSKTKNDGIELDRGGGTDNGIVRRCTVTSAGDVGIIVTGANAVVEDNVVTGASYYGFSIFQDDFGATTNAVIRRNQVKGTKKKEGIHLNAPTCSVVSNTISAPHGDGINVQQTGSTLDMNTISKAGAYGVHLKGASHNVTNNSATGSKKGDLFDESTGSMLSGNTFPKVK